MGLARHGGLVPFGALLLLFAADIHRVSCASQDHLDCLQNRVNDLIFLHSQVLAPQWGMPIGYRCRKEYDGPKRCEKNYYTMSWAHTCTVGDS